MRSASVLLERILHPSAALFVESLADGGGEGNGPVVAAVPALPLPLDQFAPDLLQSLDQVDQIAPGVGAARSGAEMGPAAEGAILVDQAFPRLGAQEGAPVAVALELRSARGPPRLRGDEGLALGKVGRRPGEDEVAALGDPGAVPLEGVGGLFPRFEVGVNGVDLLHDLLLESDEGIGSAFHGPLTLPCSWLRA